MSAFGFVIKDFCQIKKKNRQLQSFMREITLQKNIQGILEDGGKLREDGEKKIEKCSSRLELRIKESVGALLGPK